MLILLSAAAALALLTLGGAIAWEARHPARRTLAWALAYRRPSDPGELGLAFEEWLVDCPQGRRMPVWDVRLARTTGGESPGATFILLHGWGRSRIDSLGRLAAILDAVPGAFGRALLPDLRGHGESPTSTSSLGDGEELDVLALLRLAGDHKVVLAGHSLGATVAIRAAASGASEAAWVAAVIAWAPYEELGTPLANRLRASGALARPFTDVALLLLRACGIRRRRTSAAAKDLGVPLLVIAGADDLVSPLEESRAIAECAPQGRLVVLPGAHPDMHAVDPQGHAEALRGFLAGCLQETAREEVAGVAHSGASRTVA